MHQINFCNGHGHDNSTIRTDTNHTKSNYKKLKHSYKATDDILEHSTAFTAKSQLR